MRLPWLHRLDYSSLLTQPQHRDSIPEVQEFFKEIVVEQIEAIAAEHPDQEVRLYFEDEARFGQQGTITRVWAPKRSLPTAWRSGVCRRRRKQRRLRFLLDVHRARREANLG